MQTNIREITMLIGQHASLIEFGSGSSLKTRILLKFAGTILTPSETMTSFIRHFAPLVTR